MNSTFESTAKSIPKMIYSQLYSYY